MTEDGVVRAVHGCISCSQAMPTYTEISDRMGVQCSKKEKVLPEVFAGCGEHEPNESLIDVLHVLSRRAKDRASEDEWNRELAMQPGSTS